MHFMLLLLYFCRLGEACNHIGALLYAPVDITKNRRADPLLPLP